VVQGVESLGGVYSRKTIEQYHTGINHLPHKHFVILTGVSGTGKTGLATRYARTVHGIDEKSREDPFLFMCPVRPEWTDPTGLIGYYDVIGDQYVVPPFLEAMLVADNNPNTPVFVCLDEMNLARVEYYLADVLSAIESREAIDLHSGATPIKGNHGGEVPPSLRVPSNLYITGTINIDETTQPLSDKVLDRAVVLQLQASSPGHYLDRLADDDSNLEDTVEDCREVLNRVHSILADEGLAFGYRVAEEFVRYVQFARENGGRSISSLIDDQMVQKVLPKLQGSHRQRPMLNDLEALFERRGLQRSSEQIEEMKEELSEIGSFQATR
jgi:5-methylcytosine-specific restriction endonuclease McrBC GTP-binding regulatory subunit McrB